MASLASRFKSISRVGFNSSSSALSRIKKLNSLEDAIIDDQYRKGDISYDQYVSNLSDRLDRSYLTPLQRFNLRKKIDNTTQSFEEQKLYTAYKTGTEYNGAVPTDEDIYNYELSKLQTMDPNSEEYLEQANTVQTSKERLQSNRRSQYKREQLLRLSQLPEDSIENLKEKIDVYNNLYQMSVEDGDIEQAQTYETQVNNMTERYNKAQIKAQAETGLSSIESQFEGIDTGASGAFNDGRFSQPQQEVGLSVEDLEAVLSDGLDKLFNESDINKLNKMVDGFEKEQGKINQKALEGQKLVQEANYYSQLAMSARDNGLIDLAEEYEEKAQTRSDKAEKISLDLNTMQAELQDQLDSYEEEVQKVQLSASDRLVSELKSGIGNNNKLLEEGVSDFDFISKNNINPEDAKFEYVDTKRVNTEKMAQIAQYEATIYGPDSPFYNPKKYNEAVVDLESVSNNLEDIYVQAQNLDKYDFFADSNTGRIKFKEIPVSDLTTDEDGNLNFDKVYRKSGHAFYELEYVDEEGKLMDKSQVKSTRVRDLDGLEVKTTIYNNGNKEELRLRAVEDGGKLRFRADSSIKLDKGSDVRTVENFVQGLTGSEGIANFVGNVFNAGKNIISSGAVGVGVPGLIGPKPEDVADYINPPQVSAQELPRVGFDMNSVPQEYSQLIEESARRHGVRPELIAAIIRTESNFQPNATGELDADDIGIAQINLRMNPEVTREQALDPSFAIDFIGRKLAKDIKSTGSEEGAIKAYNVGVTGYLDNLMPERAQKYYDTVTGYVPNFVTETPETVIEQPAPQIQQTQQPQVQQEPVVQEPAGEDKPSVISRVGNTVDRFISGVANAKEPTYKPVVNSNLSAGSVDYDPKKPPTPYRPPESRPKEFGITSPIIKPYEPTLADKTLSLFSPDKYRSKTETNLRVGSNFARELGSDIKQKSKEVATDVKDLYGRTKDKAKNLYGSFRSLFK